MINNFRKPDLKAPRYREKRLGILNEETIKEFKEKKPLYSSIDNDKLKKIIKLYNINLWEAVIKNRDGVELPDSLGYLFIGTCPSSKTVNTNYALSKQYGKVLQNKNWETDGNLGKIFYTNWSTKYRFKNRELWRFVACREFKRAVAKTYPESWTKYVVMKNKYRVAHLYDMNTEETKKELEFYNEFET
jgi:ABC-type sugar transport system ATPase subunit